MGRELLILSIGLLFVLAPVLPVSADDIHKAIPISEVENVQAPSPRAACAMVKHNGSAGTYWGSYQTGERTVTYFDPAVECGTPAYPFRIENFSFTLAGPGGYTWPAYVDVVVYDVENPSGSCTTPGTLLYRHSVVADQTTYQYPTMGSVTLPSSFLVNGPFFIGLEYTQGIVGSTPSVVYDNNPTPDTCENYNYYTSNGSWYEWYIFWAQPGPGYPMFQVDGETNAGGTSPGDVTIRLNGGDNVAYVGEINIVEFWIRNDAELMGMSLGFEYSIGRDYQIMADHGGSGLYVQKHGDAVGAFDLVFSEVPIIDNNTSDSIGFGGAAIVYGLPIHYTSTLCYSMAVYIPPGQDALPGGFCIDNIFIPPALTWTFSSSGGGYAPTYQGYPNVQSDPFAPAVCFDIVAASPWNCTDNPPTDKVGGGSETEPNNDCQQANPAECETAYCGVIDAAGDEDWWEITIPEDTSYCLHIRVFGDDTPNQYAYGQGLDPTLTVYKEDCSTVVLFNDDNNGIFPDAENWDSQVDCDNPFNCFPPGARLYIQVKGWNSSSTGPYLLIINCEPCDGILPEGTLNLHNTDDINLFSPFGSGWDELWPAFGQTYTLTSWVDNGDGYLSVSDSVDFNGEATKYHVDWVGPTIKVYDLVMDSIRYLEYVGWDNPMVNPIIFPLNTIWHEVWPSYSNGYYIFDWVDNGNGYLDSSDYIVMVETDSAIRDYLVQSVAVDMILTGGEGPWPNHKMHFPQLPDEAGWDVKASVTPSYEVQFIADDWMCMQTGWVQDIHLWGSWKDDNPGAVLIYNLRIYSDIPDPDGSGPLYSKPGQLLADLGFTPSDIVITPIDPSTTEGWYDPYMQEILPDNHQRYYQYDFYLDTTQWFFQDSGTVYWLGVYAVHIPPGEWGWKSSLDHWNDNAVMEIDLSGEWIKLDEPGGGPLDMAFVITGEAVEGCDCMPGDADGDGKHLILDVTHLINYLYKNGPPPIPYEKCSGDADTDCSVLILDVTYLINYLYKNGPPPGSCGQWLMNCGPLQK